MFSRGITAIKKDACSILTQIRYATKKAAGSRTSMKDSAGRRLGPKKYDGQEVKVGEIIMRQRGTKFYPGDNVGIGKDHTIFALEPGIVRYYLDPFHPKRKFIGVALNREVKLPFPHFEPTLRRFGHQLLTNPKAAQKEEESLPRKQYLKKDAILGSQLKRETERKKMTDKYLEFLKNEIKLVDFDEEVAGLYLTRLRNCLKNGFILNDAQSYAKQYVLKLNKLKAQKEGWPERSLDHNIESICRLIDNINQKVSFNNRFEPIKYLSEELRKELKDKLMNDLKSITVTNRKSKEAVQSLFRDANRYLSVSEEVHLRRKFLKPVINESAETIVSDKQKQASVYKRFNYERLGVDTISRTKDAFLNKL